MPINAQVTQQKFFSQYRNGETWSLLPDDFTQWLLGSVGEKLRTEIDVQISWGTSSDGSPNDGISAAGNEMHRVAGSWLDDGISLGDIVVAWDGNGSVSAPNIVNGATVTFVDDTQMIFDVPVNVTSGNFPWVRVLGKSDLQGCFFKYGLIGNNESTNYDSKISFVEQAYSINGLVAAGTGVPLTMNAQDYNVNKSWVNGNVTCQFEGTLANGTVKKYKIIHEFIVLPYFVDGWLQNILNQSLPILFNSGNSLKYVFSADFRKTVNNPNELKIVSQDSVQGSVGWFEQNFNGFLNKFNVSGLTITESGSGAAASALIVGEKTNFSFQINNTSGNWIGTEQVIIGISYLPDQTGQENPVNEVVDNYLLETKLTTVGDAPVSDTIIKDFEVTHPGGSVLDVSVDFEYTSNQQALLDDSKYYVVWCLIGSDVSEFTANQSNALDDRAPLIVDAQQYVKNSDIPGLARVRGESGFYRHYREYQVQPRKTDVKGWIEDGYLWHVAFDKIVAQRPTITRAEFHLVAYNATTGDWFAIQSFPFDILGNSTFVPNPNQTGLDNQIIQIDARRGYNLENDDQFNWAKWNTRNPNNSGDLETHDILIGFKINWEDWLALQSANLAFFAPNQNNNGLNKESSHYQDNGYVLRTFIDMDLELPTGESTQYIISSPDFDVQYYCEDGRGDIPLWQCQIETFNAAETVNFGGEIKTDENTLIKATFTPLNYASGYDYFGIIRLDDEFGSEFSIRELSSMATVSGAFNAPSPNSELIPLPGETGTQITDTGSVVELRCLIDYTKIDKGRCYKISARLWREGVGEYSDKIEKSQDALPLVLSQAEYEPIQTS